MRVADLSLESRRRNISGVTRSKNRGLRSRNSRHGVIEVLTVGSVVVVLDCKKLDTETG